MTAQPTPSPSVGDPQRKLESPAPAAWPQIEALLAAALDMPPEARDSFLDSACAADPALRAEVAALVAASDQTGLVDTPVATLSGLLADEEVASTPRLEPGSHLGPYLLVGQLGAGGMGQVYRARDTRLNRDVAVKIVAPHLQRDATSRKRLEREARVIASLSHPNILAIFDIGEHEGVVYVVTELLTGRTLRHMIESGPLDERTVVDVASQVARGLSAAHARHVVHRDLKPENVFITREGLVKILDFGLAKPHHVDAERHTGSLTSPHTVLGTIGYMSPEQLTGDTVDARSDLFSLGAVLYEAATGLPPFAGSTRSEIAASILSSPPVFSDQPTISPMLRQTITRCLAKLPDDRYQSASDLAFTLQLASDVASGAVSSSRHTIARASARRRWVPAALGATALIALVVAIDRIPLLPDANADAPPITFVLHAPKGTSFERMTMQPFPAVSPDGRRVAFVATSGTQRMIWVQTLGELEARPLAPAAGTGPVWSADGNFIAFATPGRLQKVATSGGRAPLTVCECDVRSGISWGRDGTIVFGGTTGLFRVSAEGGEPTPLTTLDESRGESSHRYPMVLPDGRQFLYLIRSSRDENRGVYLASLDDPTVRRRVIPDDSNVGFSVGPDGHGYLFFVRDRVLLAQRFEPASGALHADPIVVAKPVIPGESGRFAPFAVGGSSLVYRLLSRSRARLTWVTRSGIRIGGIGNADANYRYPSLSQDGTKLAVLIGDPETDKPDLWFIDLNRQTATAERLTRDPVGAWFPHWTPDGQHVIYASAREGAWRMYALNIRENRERPVTDASDRIAQYPSGVTPDGRFVLAHQGRGSVWLVSLNGEAPPRQLLNGWLGRVSPDGRWLAYTASDTGVPEVYVSSFPTLGERWRISANGGEDPQWRPDGRELYYVSGDHTLTAVPVRADKTFAFGEPRSLFRVTPDPADVAGLGPLYAPAPNGERFIVTDRGAAQSPVGVDEMLLTVTMNWNPRAR